MDTEHSYYARVLDEVERLQPVGAGGGILVLNLMYPCFEPGARVGMDLSVRSGEDAFPVGTWKVGRPYTNRYIHCPVRTAGLNGSSQGGEDRGGVGVLDRERGHQIGGLIARELRGRSCRGSGLVLVRQSFIDIGHFRCLHFIQQVCRPDARCGTRACHVPAAGRALLSACRSMRRHGINHCRS